MPTRLFPSTNQRLARTVIDHWASVPASIPADLLGGLTVLDPAIRPLRPMIAGKRLAGLALTVLCEGTDYGPVHQALAIAQGGDVLVIEAGGRASPAVIGDILGGAARRRGVAGLVVNGAVRDTGILRTWDDFPVFARHITPRGPSSMDRGTVNDVIAVGGVRVSPGDLVLGDDDGLVIIPQGEAEALLAAARARMAAEEMWEKELRAGRCNLDLFSIPKAT